MDPIMKKRHETDRSAAMSPDAYAGFLKLLLTPGGRPPRPSADVDAYLRHANERDPLPADLLKPRVDRAA
jgi:hypothetical protein